MPFSNHSCFYLLFFLHLLASSAGDKLPPYTPTDLILLNCGASSTTTSLDGRIWENDDKSKFRVSNPRKSSSAFRASQQDPSVTEVPYMTARVFNSSLTYEFPVSPGSKFVRLYFYPAVYSDIDMTKSFFSIEVNNYTLVTNFSAFLTVSAIQPSVAFFKKEFIISVWEYQMLNITFYPSPKCFAFINGIEIVSMPNGLYASGHPLTYVGFGVPLVFYDLDNKTALETLYRLNVGGQLIKGVDDTGMYREWLEDSDYIFGAALGYTSMSNREINYTTSTPAFVAPPLVYSTMRSMGPDPNINMNYNLSWIFPIDSGFNYLIRLHFCETRKEITHVGQEMFSIFINNQTAEDLADVIHWGLGDGINGVALYRDYVVWVPVGSHDKQCLWLALHPATKFTMKNQSFIDAILNGLEIFKLNNSEGSLAGSNPQPILAPPPPEQKAEHPNSREKGKREVSKIVVIGPAIGAILALAFVICFFVFKQRKVKKVSSKTKHKSFQVQVSRTTTRRSSSLKPNYFCRFSIFEIEVATTKFDDEFVIGSGGFGKVYKGFIDDGATPVAIKRLDSSSRQGAREFRTEIQMLSELRQIHLVSLIGYCDDPGEMILVYEYMHRGTLRDHLYKTRNPPLPWKRRLQICIGAAYGLHYLHTGTKHPIIHRDVKSTNILIDENWVAKVSDFGLSRTGPTSESQTHVSTVVRGSLGYVDPEYYRRQHLTEKSDVYSFGVVLFEVLCARPPVIPGLPKEQVNLVDLARICYKKGALDRIMDPHLRDDIDTACLEKFGEIAYSCLLDNGAHRPTMSNVVFGLESAFQIQETAEKNRNSVDSTSSERQENPLLVRGEAVTTDDDDLFSVSGGQEEDSRTTVGSGERSGAKSDIDRLNTDSVFSEIMNKTGR